MIIDRIEKVTQYCPPPFQPIVSKILCNINQFEIGEHTINERILVKHVVVKTVPIDEAIIEDHNHHIDIQIPLNNTELMNIYNRNNSKLKTKYDSLNDVSYYKTPGDMIASARILPGYFILIEPHEMHQPQIAIGPSYTLDKIVIKIDLS